MGLCAWARHDTLFNDGTTVIIVTCQDAKKDWLNLHIKQMLNYSDFINYSKYNVLSNKNNEKRSH